MRDQDNLNAPRPPESPPGDNDLIDYAALPSRVRMDVRGGRRATAHRQRRTATNLRDPAAALEIAIYVFVRFALAWVLAFVFGVAVWL